MSVATRLQEVSFPLQKVSFWFHDSMIGGFASPFASCHSEPRLVGAKNLTVLGAGSGAAISSPQEAHHEIASADFLGLAVMGGREQ